MKSLNLITLYEFAGCVVTVAGDSLPCAAMFEIGESTVRRYETDVLEADLLEPDLDGLEVLAGR
ncbi:hypothetical protein [Haloferula sargassicola]|uniref:hypothetical protein n=1 Tax=Haloferula sargassicola TaxID=490096 RepID=UPI0033659F5C